MQPKVIDTNVPLTASGRNEVVPTECQEICAEFIRQVIYGDIIPVIDDANEAIEEYGRKVPRNGRSEDIAGQFLIHIQNNLGNARYVQMLNLDRDADGQFIDCPDNTGAWQTDEPRCHRFDEDDKKWVALARRFKIDTGKDAPIANAADRCWRAFESHLRAAGVLLEFLCVDEATPPPTDARA